MGEHVIKLPDVGEGVAEAELVEWHVKVGDLVREDALLAAVMTDKATVEIPSPRAGTIAKINYAEGQVCPVGQVLLRHPDRLPAPAHLALHRSRRHASSPVLIPRRPAPRPTARGSTASSVVGVLSASGVACTPCDGRKIPGAGG